MVAGGGGQLCGCSEDGAPPITATVTILCSAAVKEGGYKRVSDRTEVKRSEVKATTDTVTVEQEEDNRRYWAVK